MKNPENSIPGIKSNPFREIPHNDSETLRKAGIKSPDISKMEKIKVNSKTIVYK